MGGGTVAVDVEETANSFLETDCELVTKSVSSSLLSMPGSNQTALKKTYLL